MYQQPTVCFFGGKNSTIQFIPRVRFPFVFLATLIVDEVANLRRCSLLKMRQEIAKWRHGYSGYVNRASLEFTI